MRYPFSLSAGIVATMVSLTANGSCAPDLSIRDEAFGCTRDGKPVRLFTLTNTNGITAKVLTFGGTIYSLEVPDRQGRFVNVNANRATLPEYEDKGGAFGALLGRYANRIAKGRLVIDGKEYSLPLNGAPNHIHGGPRGFDKQVWSAEPVRDKNAVGLRLTYTARDGESGFPGNLNCTVLYQLNTSNEWRMEYTARTDKPTVVNMSNHSYWNLGGACSGTVLDHLLTVNAEKYVRVDDTLIPTGEFAPVEGTPLDFRSPHKVGERIGNIPEPHFRGGYDHCLVVPHEKPGDLAFCARLEDPASGRVMEVYTTQPGVQIYSANAPSGSHAGPGNYAYPKHAGFCLETQHYPDSPNHPGFPSTVLRPGQTYHEITVHRFSVK